MFGKNELVMVFLLGVILLMFVTIPVTECLLHSRNQDGDSEGDSPDAKSGPKVQFAPQSKQIQPEARPSEPGEAS